MSPSENMDNESKETLLKVGDYNELEYKSVELPEENKYEVSGKALAEFEKMVDAGLINEAENILLESIDDTKIYILVHKYVKC